MAKTERKDTYKTKNPCNNCGCFKVWDKGRNCTRCGKERTNIKKL